MGDIFGWFAVPFRIAWEIVSGVWRLATGDVISIMCTSIIVVLIIAFVVGDEIDKRRR